MRTHRQHTHSIRRCTWSVGIVDENEQINDDDGEWVELPLQYYDIDAAIGEFPFEYLKRYLAELDRIRELVRSRIPESHIYPDQLLLPDAVYAEARRYATAFVPWEPAVMEPGPDPHAVDIRVWCDYCGAPPGGVCITASGRSAMWAHACRRRNPRLVDE